MKRRDSSFGVNLSGGSNSENAEAETSEMASRIRHGEGRIPGKADAWNAVDDDILE